MSRKLGAQVKSLREDIESITQEKIFANIEETIDTAFKSFYTEIQVHFRKQKQRMDEIEGTKVMQLKRMHIKMLIETGKRLLDLDQRLETLELGNIDCKACDDAPDHHICSLCSNCVYADCVETEEHPEGEHA